MQFGRKLEMDLDGAEPVVVEYDARDIRAWEAEHGRSFFSEPTSVTMLTWLGWQAAMRVGAINGSLSTWDQFDKACTGVQFADSPKRRRGRTRSGPSDASSPPSQSGPESQ